MPSQISGESTAKVSGGRPRNPNIDQAVLEAAAKLVLANGLRAVSMDAIAAEAGVGRMAIYRRWPNKAAIVMSAFVARVDPTTLFAPATSYLESIRLQMRTMAKAFRGKDGALLRILLAEAQHCPEVAEELRERWTMPRRKMAIVYFEQGIQEGWLRADVDPNTMIDVLYAPLYYRLQMGTGPLTDTYVDQVFEHAMRGLRRSAGKPRS
ncbi:TetR/AcrR family transcriptional regulator [Terriglobus sp. ADX1]|uniref:TetR/AcrR family transcriptional regulator n=1 Tax=Terriglobus sp. ADX1 TaxID=2794063 RepID=UPI002FE6B932